ncbi:hypothetical protein ACFL3D_04565 [Candidatus Omnitrophota bacterium]
MRKHVLVIAMIALCVCVTSCTTTKTTSDGYQVKAKYDERITAACEKSRNIFYISKSEVLSEFGRPQEKSISPKDTSGQTELYKYQSSTGRVMEVYIKGDKVVDVNYTASIFGLGAGGGRKQKEKQRQADLKRLEEEKIQRLEEAALEQEESFEEPFFEEDGIVMEEREDAILAFMEEPQDGEGRIFAEESMQELEDKVVETDIDETIEEDSFSEDLEDEEIKREKDLEQTEAAQDSYWSELFTKMEEENGDNEFE